MRRPRGLTSEKARRLFDALVLELEADTHADREQVALAVRFRMKQEALLDADRMTASNEAGRRADKILGALRRRPGFNVQHDADASPRLRWLRAGGLDGDVDALIAQGDEDVVLVARLFDASHWNDMPRATQLWLNGETDERPDVPIAA